MLRLDYLLSITLIAGCSSPPAPIGPMPRPAPVPIATAPVAEPPPAAPPPPAVASGVVRTEGQSTSCERVVSITPDGGAELLCTFGREDGCGIREIGPDGEERKRSQLAPGECEQWVPRAEGGGVLVTRRAKELVVTAIDVNGKRGASNRLVSKRGSIYGTAATATPDGGVAIALVYYGDIGHGGRQLGKSDYGVAGIVKFTRALERMAWARLFGTRRTDIATLLPTSAGVDAVIETRGPLVAGAPVNPEPDANGMFGGNTYGWRAEQVAFDGKGEARTRQELAVGPERSISGATVVAGRLATKTWSQEATVIAFRGEPSTELLRLDSQQRVSRFETFDNRTWVTTTRWIKDGDKHKPVSKAYEIGGQAGTIELAGQGNGTWLSLVTRGDRVVALGVTTDPATQVPVSFVALARLDAPSIDLARLAPVDKLQLAAGCRGLTKPDDLLKQASEQGDALAACGLTDQDRVRFTTFPDGGLRTLEVEKAKPAITACARKVLDPVFACPGHSGQTTFNPLAMRARR
jgi:hypothetical protein